jgi:hypothetical protein
MNIHRILQEKSLGAHSFGRPRRRWKDNIKIDFGAVYYKAETTSRQCSGIRRFESFAFPVSCQLSC